MLRFVALVLLAGFATSHASVPAPWAAQLFSYSHAINLSLDTAETARPLVVEVNGDALTVTLGMPDFTVPMDVAFGVQFEGTDDVHLLDDTGSFHSLRDGMVYYRTGISERFEEVVLTRIPVSALSFGEYRLYALAKPSAGGLDRYYLWTTTFSSGVVTGRVVDGNGTPVPNALVRLQTTNASAMTDANGAYSLAGVGDENSLGISAWAQGYYIAGGEVARPGEFLDIVLQAYSREDDETYEWVAAHSGDDLSGGHCQGCHARVSEDQPRLIFDDWVEDAHSKSATNHRFLNMFFGTDVNGNRSPDTTYVIRQDYGSVPLPPDLSQPYHGPGYRLDFPDNSGNCSTCHAPFADVGADIENLNRTEREGVSCDFCHKIKGVDFDPVTERPHEGSTGVLSFNLIRPEPGHQLFIGPLDDVAPGEDTFDPGMKQSAICAPCHSATFWGTRIYDSYGEWLESDYADPRSANQKTCQQCHMPTGMSDHFVRLDRGGRLRDPSTIANHLMPGRENERFLSESATLYATYERESMTEVTITVTNSGTGHHLPTGSPLRNVFLLVEGYDAEGNLIEPLSAPLTPDWAGDIAGRPGRGYAKVLEEQWTGVTPSGAYWNPTTIREDSRIPAHDSDVSRYAFPLTVEQVTARLIYRRAFHTLQQQKGWSDPDITMRTITLEIE